MFIEPGMFELASKSGIKAGLADLNDDGKIDSTDMNMARANIQDPMVSGTVSPVVKQQLKETLR